MYNHKHSESKSAEIEFERFKCKAFKIKNKTMKS